jgi:hypothetical protein
MTKKGKKEGKKKFDWNKLKTFNFYKNNWHYIVIFFLIIWGYQLRAYHIDYPSIGYHNMKENIYLMQAYHMYEGGSPFELSMLYYADKENTFQKDMLPLIAWSTVILWKIAGSTSLFWPRLIMIICSLANILLIYWFVNLITKKKELGLISALLMTFMPIGVFFGRNIQPDVPGVTFILLFSIYFYKWIKDDSRKTFIYFILYLTIAINLKITNLVGLIPFMFIVPYKRVFTNLKKYIPEFIIGLIACSTPYIWKYIQILTMPAAANDAHVSIFLELFDGYSSSYLETSWRALESFLRDNFTMWYVWFCIFGLVFALFKYKTVIGKYLIGFIVAFWIYFTILPGFMVRHNYYQSPFLTLVVISSAYIIYVCGSLIGDLLSQILNIKKFMPAKNFKIILIYLLTIFIFLLTINSVFSSINRQFDTQFFGCDVAGNYIKENSGKDEKIFLGIDPSGQTVSMLWAAKRYGAWINYNLSRVKTLEKEKNFNRIFLYGNALNTMQTNKRSAELWEYVEQNYRIEQIGAVMQNNQPVPYYFVLKKGGKFNLSDFATIQIVPATEYELTSTKLPFYTATIN